MNLNTVARYITLKEGGKVSVSIGQVKEILRLTLIEFAKYPTGEVLKTLAKYRGK